METVQKPLEKGWKCYLIKNYCWREGVDQRKGKVFSEAIGRV